MGDIGLLKQGWRWVQSQKQAIVGTWAAASCARDKLVFLIDRHWPGVCRSGVSVGMFLLMLLMRWRDCAVEGFRSLVGLGSAALFLIIWSCFLSLTSTSYVVYALLSLGAAGAAIRYLGYTPGLFIVGFFGILIMWIYGNVWITGMMFIVGGYMFSLNHARLLVFISAAYAVYCVNARVGLLGVFLSLNLSFLSHDLLNRVLQGHDGVNESPEVDEHMESEPVVEDFTEDHECFPPTNESDTVTKCKSSCKTPSASNTLNIQKDASASKVVKTDSTSLEEMKRIVDSSNHYEALGFDRNKCIDLIFLKKEYRKKAMLVHPDKNMGNPLASESFKKLQCAYEVLSDSSKKKNYDEQLRKDESGKVCQKPHFTSHQDGSALYRSEESRRIECTKCGNSHIWICTNRSKSRARWCQDCSMYHQARDGDGWVENSCSRVSSSLQKVEIPRAFVCAESKIFDVSEWAICQGMVCRPNTHRPSFHVNMVGLERMAARSSPSRFPWGFDAELTPEDDEFELWLQQALASGLFSDTPKRRKSWSPFKIPQKGMKPWRRSP